MYNVWNNKSRIKYAKIIPQLHDKLPQPTIHTPISLT